MSAGAVPPPAAARRLDQWLWFARLAKSRSLATRRCAAGAVAVNDVAIGKANVLVHINDIVTLSQGPWQRRIRIVALGQRRGPAAEARGLYEEVAAPVRRAAPAPDWVPLLADE